MGSNSKKRAKLQQQIEELEIKKRNGLMRAIAAFVGLFVLIAIKTYFVSAGFEWANSTFANMGIFMLAIVAAGVAGMGTRAWKRSKDKITDLRSRVK